METCTTELGIYDKLAEATTWGLEIDLAEETLVRLALDS